MPRSGQAGRMRGTWDRRRVAAIAVGGALGAAIRWAVIASVEAGRFPWPVLVLNLAGSVLLGVLLAEEWRHRSARLLLHDLGAIGFCGGLTTFSTFAIEVVDLVRHGHAGTAAVYAATSVTAALGGIVAGAAAAHRVLALTLPLEEEP